MEQRKARSSCLVSYAWQLQLWPVLAMNGILLVLVATEIVLKRVHERQNRALLRQPELAADPVAQRVPDCLPGGLSDHRSIFNRGPVLAGHQQIE